MKNNNLIETISYRGCNIEVIYDESSFTPDDNGDDEVFLVYDHRQFCVERKGFEPRDIFDNGKSMYKGYHVFVCYAYIHSGVALSVGSHNFPDARWDVSSTGYVLIKKEKGWSWTKEKALKLAEGLVEEWNQYLSGDTYGYNIEETDDSCWGYCGSDGKEQMIAEAKQNIDYYLEKIEKNLPIAI